MRILAALLIIMTTAGIAQADMFYQNNNPFPNQVCPQNLNNIYETTPEAIEQDKNTAKKFKKSIKNNVEEDVKTPVRAEDSGFVIFK